MNEVLYSISVVVAPILASMSIYYGAKWAKMFVREWYRYHYMPPFRMLLISLCSAWAFGWCVAAVVR